MRKESERTNKLTKELKNDLKKLAENINNNQYDVSNLKKKVDKIQRELIELNPSLEKKYYEEEQDQTPDYEMINNMEIKKRLFIKNKKISSSFANWFFNNKEV